MISDLADQLLAHYYNTARLDTPDGIADHRDAAADIKEYIAALEGMALAAKKIKDALLSLDYAKSAIGVK